MRVLHLAAGNLFGGVETYLLTLACLRNLCPEMEPHFGICFPGRLRDELTAAGVPVYDLGAVRASRPWTVLRCRHRLKTTIRNKGIEAVVTHGSWPHAMFAPVMRRCETRLVNFVHDTLSKEHWINRWAARTPPDEVIANSRFTADKVDSVFAGVPVDVCYLPVAAPDIANREQVRREMRDALATAADSVVILQASRLERWKGQAVHIEALSGLKDLPGWVAWIAGGPQKVGEAEFLDELKSSAERAGLMDRIRFLGQRSDVQRLMIASDIYCQPNTGPEPFGIVFVEALYAGLPVVTSSFGGAKEIVDDECGVLCPPREAGVVATALRQMIADPSRRRLLGLAGPARARELCEPQRQMAELAHAISTEVEVRA